VGRRGAVFFDRDLAGWIEETADGMTFRYEPAWLARADAQPVSLTLPLAVEPYTCRGLHPFFAGLLPEGWLFEISISTLKLSPDDGFGLLLALCRDCTGAVRIEPVPEGGRLDG
jgi:serine/threonine-protein kinase HipA